MTLTTHALVGAAAASLFPQEPLLAFAAGFVSHFCIDAIPHWDYELSSLEKDLQRPLNTRILVGKNFWINVAGVAGDAIIGFAISAVVFGAWLFHVPFFIILIGAFGALVPDGLHFIYFRTHTKLLVPLERFHNWIQKVSPLDIPAWMGLGLQAALVVAVIGVLKIFHPVV
jgi:hypothetical protein